MQDRAIVAGIIVVSLVLFSIVDNWLDRKNNYDSARRNYTGIKDDEHTDDFLPW